MRSDVVMLETWDLLDLSDLPDDASLLAVTWLELYLEFVPAYCWAEA